MASAAVLDPAEASHDRRDPWRLRRELAHIGCCTTTTSWTTPLPAAASRVSMPSGATCEPSWRATICWVGHRNWHPTLAPKSPACSPPRSPSSRGQILELESAYDPTRTVERYERSITGKTASLLATACRIGAIVGELPRPVVESLTEFGLAYGMAFQVADDILDIATDEELGKLVGNDLRGHLHASRDPRPRRRTHATELRPLLTSGITADERSAQISSGRVTASVPSTSPRAGPTRPPAPSRTCSTRPARTPFERRAPT